jgi:hypothetical protein
VVVQRKSECSLACRRLAQMYLYSRRGDRDESRAFVSFSASPFLPQHKEPDCETIILLHATARMLCVEGRQYWCDTGNSHTNDRGRDKDGLQIDRKRLKISKRLPPPPRTSRRNACV